MEPSKEPSKSVTAMAATQTLKQPGEKLFLTPLLKAKKYRNYGNNKGALEAWSKLEESGLGKVIKKEIKGSGMVSCILIRNTRLSCYP